MMSVGLSPYVHNGNGAGWVFWRFVTRIYLVSFFCWEGRGGGLMVSTPFVSLLFSCTYWYLLWLFQSCFCISVSPFWRPVLSLLGIKRWCRSLAESKTLWRHASSGRQVPTQWWASAISALFPSPSPSPIYEVHCVWWHKRLDWVGNGCCWILNGEGIWLV